MNQDLSLFDNSDSTQLIVEADNALYADSRVVAVGFGIEHHSLAKSLSQHFTDLKSINPSKSGITGGRPEKAYLLTERQVMMLPAICAVTPQLKAFQSRLVDAFLAYRAKGSHPIPQTMVEALRLAADSIERAEAAEAKVAELEPKADRWTAFMNSDGLLTMQRMAGLLGIGRQTLFSWCRALKLFPPSKNVPYAEYQAPNRFVMKVNEKGFTYAGCTPTGFDWLCNKLRRAGYGA
jgi:phage antirepressor YoqD-like protein